MSGDRNPKGRPSLPDDIAAEAGMPRAADLGHALHDVGERIGRDTESALDAARDAADQTVEAAHEGHDRAGDAADSVRERVRASASDARERAQDAYDDVRGWASDRYDDQRARASDFADRHVRRYRDGRRAAEDFVSDNPLLIGVVGLAAGLLLGALLPRTQREDETFGPYADEVRDQGLRYARDVTQQGRAFVERALDPDNLDDAVQRAGDREDGYEGSERTAHRL